MQWWDSVIKKSKKITEKSKNNHNFLFYSIFFFFENLAFSVWVLLRFFSFPEQLNRWPCHSVSHSVTQSLTVRLLLTNKERPKRHVTFETFDQSDEEIWNDHFFQTFSNFFLSIFSTFSQLFLNLFLNLFSSFLAVQNSSIADLVTHSLAHSLSKWPFDYDKQKATLETCDLSNIWSEKLEDITWPKKLTMLDNYLTMFTILDNFLQFWTILTTFKFFFTILNFFLQFSTNLYHFLPYWQFFIFFYNFGQFWQCALIRRPF